MTKVSKVSRVYMCLCCKALSDHKDEPKKCPDCGSNKFIQGIEYIEAREVLKPLMSKEKRSKK